ncbi:hypothetical protein A6R68_01596 [Neotoma lepida]|uniref:Uncharacterized protein n=1 Tax=Neotoma lepida TaxID=56216 RepID=A0A1A6GU60_NEOLE|nr:hypothetical protein A6R68_01596 [Neotoma lepida]
MSSLEISNSCFRLEMKLPLSSQLVEDSASEPSRKDVADVEGKPKDIIQFTDKKLSRLKSHKNEIRKICSDIRQKWPVRHIVVFHQLGLVLVTEASTIIAVSSAHRATSLEAVSYAIDSLKVKVPIGEKEIYEESASSWKRNKECF